MRLLWLALPAVCLAQPFPARYHGDLTELKSTMDAGVATARVERLGSAVIEGRDRAGKPWSVALESVGLGAPVWSGDFDADGQRDLLIVRQYALLGACADQSNILLLLFDERGRPVPSTWTGHPSLGATGRSREAPPEWLKLVRGRAQFQVISCERERRWVSGVMTLLGYRAGRRQTDAEGRVDEIHDLEFGCEACSEPLGRRVFVGGKPQSGWPERVVMDGVAGREIYVGDGNWPALRRVIHGGHWVTWRGGELWADGSKAAPPKSVAAELRVIGRKVQPVKEQDGICPGIVFEAGYEVTKVRRCADRVTMERAGTRKELYSATGSIRVSHTAMGVTHGDEVRLAPPVAGARLVGFDDWRSGLTQWFTPAGGLVLAQHLEDGRLAEAGVAASVKGYLVWGTRGPAFWLGPNLIEVRGTLVWRAVR